jgi:nitrite reductase/ring-hydroxylating ferredoxin subunit
MIFLKYADLKSFKNYQKFYNSKMKNETFEVKKDGQIYEIQRYCPHAFGDLSKGIIDGDNIYCPLHNWCFSLIDGKGIDNLLKINVKRNKC